MLPRRYRLGLVLVLLPMLLACGLGTGTPAGEPRVSVSPEAADRMAQKLKQSIRRGEGTFDLEFTDAELTSYVVLEVSQQLGGPKEMPVQDFQVRFTDGQVILSGRLTSVSLFKPNVEIAAWARVEDGLLDVRLGRAQVGALSMPGVLLRSLSRVVSESILEAPERLERAAEITSVEIDEGVMRIGGRLTERGK